MRRVGLYTLFFLSGASALVYELVWQRLLTLVFGVSTLSVSTVLAAFMGGLALGGLLFGRLADRSARPLRLYGWLEAGVGLCALLVPAGFAALTAVYTGLHAAWSLGPWGGAALRLVLSLLVLTPPATLLGGTLPVMARLAARRTGEEAGAFSLLYAVNTLGAVAGAALTGFVFLHYLGMRQTTWLAVGVNGVVALSALLAGRGACHAFAAGQGHRGNTTATNGRESMPPSGSAPHGRLTLVLAALTGATCTGLEVVWSRILGILTSNSAYGFALLLTVLLLGLGVGGLLQAALARHAGDPWRRLAVCQWLLAGATLAAAPFFHTTPDWLVRLCDGRSAGAVFLGELALTAAALFVPAVCMGLALPLLVTAAAGGRPHFGARLGRLYAVNTLGCAAGAVAAGFVLVPRLGIHATLGLCVAAPVAVGLAAWRRAERPARPWRWAFAAAAAKAAAVAWFILPSGGYYKSTVSEPRKLLYYAEGDNATVAVVEEANAARCVLVDGQPVAGTAGTSVVDQKMLAHLPLLLHPAPRRALTVGFGSGGTSHSMTLHGVDVDCVEIEAKVPAAADCFTSENDGVRAHPHFRLVLDDARAWLRVAPAPYDVIVTDCTNIQYRSNGDLYTVDYFRLMRDRLRPGGVAAAWVPANGIRDADLRTLLRSFREAFPHTSVWFMDARPTDFLIVVGTPGRLDLDLDAWRRRMARPGVAEDLAAVGQADPERLAYTLLAAGDKLDAYIGAGPLNTDDRPVLCYSTYGAGFEATAADNLVHLLHARVDAARFVRSPADATDLLRHYAASNELVLGHVCWQRGQRLEALLHYVNGAKLLPGDAGVWALVRGGYAAAGPLDEECEPK
jgi:spermidine synthase